MLSYDEVCGLQIVTTRRFTLFLFQLMQLLATASKITIVIPQESTIDIDIAQLNALLPGPWPFPMRLQRHNERRVVATLPAKPERNEQAIAQSQLLTGSEDALQNKVDALKKKENELNKKEDDLKNKRDELIEREWVIHEKEEDVEKKEAELDDRQLELENKEASVKQRQVDTAKKEKELNEKQQQLGRQKLHKFAGDKCETCQIMKCSKCPYFHLENRCYATGKECDLCGEYDHYRSHCPMKRQLESQMAKDMKEKKK